jgi:hypothetical protein
MKTISAEQARANIVAAYTKQHNEVVAALSATLKRVKATKSAEVKSETDSKSSLASLLLAESEE